MNASRIAPLVGLFSHVHGMSAILSYINGSLEELRQVRWPTQQQAIRLTIIVIGFIAVTAAAFGLIDGALTQIIRWTLSPLLS